MKTRFLALFFFCISTLAFAEVSGPSVWTQMQLKNINSVEAVIESLELDGASVLVDFKSEGRSQRLELCRDLRNESLHGAPFLQQKIEMLRTALRSREKVQLGLTGPWSPCLDSVKISQAQ